MNITAEAGDNRLIGNDRENRIEGGLGLDIMTGKGGIDFFVFNSTDDSTSGAVDRITDFEQGTVLAQGDMIDLLGIDAVDGGRNNAFTFVGTDAFSNTAGELRYENRGANTYVYGDTDGDGVADLEIRIDGIFVLEDADFVL
ncbi:MAG: M10 family metallopeptidase C-terminal domain-containing protein [Alterinioella nitratireducens]|uniref:M10 family metallopeptidase C-terminal domain-containing protein n=1 Tax=Alterinioella nitratireducens TaxID=2735915 RepID=UPI004057D09D